MLHQQQDPLKQPKYIFVDAQASLGGQDPGPSPKPEPEVFNHRERGSRQRSQGMYIKREGDCLHRRPSNRD